MDNTHPLSPRELLPTSTTHETGWPSSPYFCLRSQRPVRKHQVSIIRQDFEAIGL